MQADILDALATWLDTQTTVPVHYPEVKPADYVKDAESIVITPGGEAYSAGSRSYIPVARQRADVRCYGPNAYRALAISREVAGLLKNLTPRTVEIGPAGDEVDVRIYNAILVSGPIALPDPDTKEACVYATWGVLGSELEIAA